MGDMLVSLWSIMANFGFETDELARKISNIIGTDEDGNYTGTLAPVADIPIVGIAIGLFAEFGSTAGQVTPPTVS